MNSTTTTIDNQDLYKRQYSIDVLEQNIYNLSLKPLLKTQKLTAEFCIKYILTTDDYADCYEDTLLDLYDVLRFQPHLSEADFLKLHAEHLNILQTSSCDLSSVK